ncbi:hypothetical protein [Nocardia transvalensis]|uniref:hypothetical protein n=1 Tax=Nocardia transvalensis TaxID=37333 RepID=UPI001892E248|nr:hypothetical protein [Nocardia transvalensis]MBF6333371.1 hypothetical protein [Nocardia transvalensis]
MGDNTCTAIRCQHGVLAIEDIAGRLRVTAQLVRQWRSQPKPHPLADKGFRLNGDSGPLRWIECDYWRYLEDLNNQARSA